MSNINYDFRSSAFAPWFFRELREVAREKHLEQLAPEYPSLFKDMDINALKVDAEAVNILTAACETISIILEARRNNPNKPVYAALGEIHIYPAHRLHHMLVLKDLNDRGFKLSVGLESSEEQYRKYFLTVAQEALGDDYCEQTAREYFDDHNLALEISLVFTSKESPYSNLMLHKFLLEQSKLDGCTYKFTDVTRAPDHEFLDDNDAHVEKHAEGQTEIGSFTVKGMSIRNKGMVDNLPSEGVMIQPAGLFHIDDMGRLDTLNADTLIAHAKDAGYWPIGRVLLDRTTPQMNAEQHPDRTFANQKYLSAARTISDIRFHYDRKPETLELVVHGEEIAYVNTKLNVLGMGDVCNVGLLELISHARSNISKHIEAVGDIVRAKPAPPVGHEHDEFVR